MLALATDEDFNEDIVRGLRRRHPSLDLVRVQDELRKGADDPAVLAWCAEHGRVLFTHDVSTMSGHAYARTAAGLVMPGVFEVSQSLAVRTAIEDILLLAELSLPGEWEGQVRYLPLR